MAVVLIIVVARQPSDFIVARTISLSAPVSRVFVQVNNLRNWDAWSPWAKLDPNSKIEFTGPDDGIGANMRWSGNNKVGVGGMTIIESRPDEFIRFRLEFLKPFKATNTADFSFCVAGNQTTLTWSMSGQNNFIGKLMGLIMNCDNMVGTQFEQGLSAIKDIVETNRSGS